VRVDGPWPTEADYAWIENWEARELGFCVALVRGRTPADVLSRLVSDPPTGIVSVEEARRWAEAQTLPDYGTTIEAGTVGDWAVAVELNGYRATLEPVLRSISEDTVAIVVFCNVNAVMSFQWAVNGAVVRWFDPLLYENPSWAGEPLPEERDLPFGVEHALSSAFACAERLSGVRLTQALLEDRTDWLTIGHHPM